MPTAPRRPLGTGPFLATMSFSERSPSRHLGQVIAVEDVSSRAEDSTMRITIAYRILRNNTKGQAEFSVGGGS